MSQFRILAHWVFEFDTSVLRDVLLLNIWCLPCSPQYVEAISNKQTELDNYIAEGYKNALSEERRRYCFLVDRQCAVAKNSSSYHSKVGTRVGDPGRVGWISTFPWLFRCRRPGLKLLCPLIALKLTSLGKC